MRNRLGRATPQQSLRLPLQYKLACYLASRLLERRWVTYFHNIGFLVNSTIVSVVCSPSSGNAVGIPDVEEVAATLFACSLSYVEEVLSMFSLLKRLSTVPTLLGALAVGRPLTSPFSSCSKFQTSWREPWATRESKRCLPSMRTPTPQKPPMSFSRTMERRDGKQPFCCTCSST